MENLNQGIENIAVPKISGPKIIGKIDLGDNTKRFSKKIENREALRTKLDLCLEKMAQNVNNDFPDFLRADGRINMNNDDYYFSDKEGDLNTIQIMESSFAAGQAMTDWIKKREESNGMMIEKSITVLLHKMLQDDFIVARTSLLDDYRHGVDNLIIDKKTGAAICGFDEVQSANNQESDRNTDLKKIKILENISKYQGAFIKYGATIKNNDFKRCSLRNVPTFFLTLSEGDVADITTEIDNKDVSSNEKKVLLNMVLSIESQMSELYGEHTSLEGDFREQRGVLMERMNALSQRYGADAWGKTPEGVTLKKELGVNKLRINLHDFKLSLQTIKQKL